MKTQREFAVEVVRQLRDAGFESVWAGGCVRDELMGHDPKDYDVATDAQPDQIREVFGRSRTLAIGAAFGVITVLNRKPKMEIEVATFRCDGDYTDGRRPDEVTFSTMHLDANRRDFTINGIFHDPISDKIIDYVGGREDLAAGIIRAIGDPRVRIGEDKLRMLRAIRFAATFGFEVELTTWEAIRENASEIRLVSAERIAAEMRRMLAHNSRVEAVKMLHECKLLKEILPESIRFEVEDVYRSTLELLSHVSTETDLDADKFVLAFAAVALGIVTEPADVETIGRRWKLSNEERERIGFLLSNYERVLNATDEYWPSLQRLLIQPHAMLLLEFASMIVKAGVAAGGAKERQRESIEFCRERLAWPIDKLNPPALIGGNDLKNAGITIGPLFSEIIERVRDAQLAGEINSTDQAIELARKISDGQ